MWIDAHTTSTEIVNNVEPDIFDPRYWDSLNIKQKVLANEGYNDWAHLGKRLKDMTTYYSRACPPRWMIRAYSLLTYLRSTMTQERLNDLNDAIQIGTIPDISYCNASCFSFLE
ncbi:hypothetical protein ACJX0J_013804, partial [Zea mays]